MRPKISRLAGAMGVAAVAAVLALAGCGSGDQNTSAGAQATSATAAPTTTPAPTTTAPAATVPPTSTPTCGNVQFSSDSEDVATQIIPTGLSCADAQAFVRTAGAQLISSTGPPKVDIAGYSCVRAGVRAGDHGAPVGTFECTNGAMKVVFNRGLVG